MKPLDDATHAQVRASDPAASTWVTANAGSGKTKVLTDRVARLLLHGTEPQKILCLTYTKAAAAEMQNRLFSRLGSWAMMPDDTLQKTLAELGEKTLDAEALRKARRLFANALETPGGLKIQTIHAFCEKILRRFPLEAGVPPRFEVLDESLARELRARAVDAMAENDAAHLVAALAEEITGADPDDLLREVAQRREILRLEAVHQVMGRDSDPEFSARMADILGSDGRETLAGVADVAGGSVQYAARLADLAREMDPARFVSGALGEFVFGSKAKEPFGPRRLGASKLRDGHPELFERLDAMCGRVAEARDRIARARLVNRAERLARFAEEFLARYDRAKLLAGQLDFDDLIQRAAALLGRSASAQWVLYRLDGGIDHILVDEAQDTSPAQWKIIERLAEEFMAGEGSAETARTIFVVGDEKQSIYSFQGADPAEFSRMRQDFANRLADAGSSLQDARLRHSFRSSGAILRAVDAVFHGTAGQQFEKTPTHAVFHGKMPGRVDLWPFLEKEPEREEAPWYQPVDMPDPADPRKTLALQVADWIAWQIDPADPKPLPGTGRAIRAGDFLILVQTRGAFFRHVIRGLKALGVPVAGADRMKLGEEVAVLDILALLRWADLPDDDLALAEALRSPLLGLSEGELFFLAHGRTGHLWPVLRGCGRFAEQVALLQDVLDKADYLRPYELIERVLTHHKGRENLLARLGEEVEEAIDELMSQALVYEQRDIPTLAGFLHWFARETVEVKREMDSGAGEVRVMTVHGAKGLEAPIVLLPDTEKRKGAQDRSVLLDLADGGFAWRGGGVDKEQARELLSAQARRKAFLEEERLRLLYVAMTRAERWLVIAGAGDKGASPAESWYGLVEEAFLAEAEGDVPAFLNVEDPVVGAMLSQRFNWSGTLDAKSGDGRGAPPDLPGWALRPAPQPATGPKVINPSAMPGDKVLPGPGGLSEDAAKTRGSQIHVLLEHLPNVPRAEHFSRAQNMLKGEFEATKAELETVLTEVQAVLDAPDLGWIFGPDVLAEVPLVGDLPSLGGRRLAGVVDRLDVGAERVVAVDFKTNAVVPDRAGDTPVGILRQLGAYAEVLAQIYPDREIEVGVLWTATATYMSIDHGLVMAALASTPPS